jgi:hypothetical protein
MERNVFLQLLAGSGLMAGWFGNLRYPDGTPSRDDLINLWMISGELALEFADAMPEDNYLFRPEDAGDIYTFGGQMQHIAENNVSLIRSYLSDDPPPEIPVGDESDKPTIMKNIDISFDYGAEAIRSLSRNDLTRTVDFFAAPLPRWHVLFIAQDHTTHHIGQSTVYLRMNGIAPPRWRKWPVS